MRVLMVCMGNICRSPTAEGVLRARLQAEGLAEVIAVDSAGTHGFHKGSPPDPRAVARAQARGYALGDIRSRPVTAADFERHDFVLAMDHENLSHLRDRCPPPLHERLGLLLAYAPALGVDEVPDPYYGGPEGFDQVLDLVESACDGFVPVLQQRLAARP